MNVGNSLKIALLRRGKTQTQLARELGKHVQWINGIANKKMASMASVEVIATALDMKVSEFLALGED